MTWQLWRAIRQPTPVMRAFTWAVPERPPRSVQPFRWRNVLFMLLGIGVLFVISPSLLLSGLVALLFAPLLAVAFNGVLLGLLTAARVSVGVARLRESKSWDVVRSTPLGAWGSAWAVAVMSAAHVGNTTSGRILAWLARTVGVVGALLLGVSLLSLLGDEVRLVARELAPYTTACLLFIVDHVQTPLFACLWGLLAARIAHSSTEARLLAMVGFVAARFVGYALLIGTISTLYAGFTLGWRDDAPLLAGGLAVLLYVSANEVTLQVLWRAARGWYRQGYA